VATGGVAAGAGVAVRGASPPAGDRGDGFVAGDPTDVSAACTASTAPMSASSPQLAPTRVFETIDFITPPQPSRPVTRCEVVSVLDGVRGPQPGPQSRPVDRDGGGRGLGRGLGTAPLYFVH